ncbi:MAG: inositol monophosphatase family protein [Brevinematia bacterium]
MNYREMVIDAMNIAKRAGEVLREGFYRILEGGIEYELKGYADPVTEYDKRSESIVVEELLSKYPRSAILSEEVGEYSLGEGVRWIVDPLDGTVNFIHAIPFISISIALEVDNEIVGGVVYNPVLDEMYYAIIGEGSYFNNRRIFVSKVSSAQQSLVVTGFPYLREGRVEELMKPLPTIIRDYQGFRRIGSASIDLVYVARGSFEVFYEENLKPWDTSAGKIIVEEAGGKVTDYRGNKYTINSKTIIASNGLIHDQILLLLEGVSEP